MDPVVHFEMPAKDKKRMSEFYAKVFGWQTKQLGPEMGNYVLVTTSETEKSGLPKEPGRINGGFYDRSESNQSTTVVIAVLYWREYHSEALRTLEPAVGERR